MAQAWESSAPDENKDIEMRVWQSGQFAIAQTFSHVLQKAWLLPVEQMVCYICCLFFSKAKCCLLRHSCDEICLIAVNIHSRGYLFALHCHLCHV